MASVFDEYLYKSRYYKIDKTIRDIIDAGCYIAGVGSQSYSDDDKIHLDTDFDLIIVSSNLRSALNVVMGHGDAPLSDKAHCIAIREVKREQQRIGCIIFSEEAFPRTSTMQSGTVRYFRPIGEKTRHHMRSVHGAEKWALTPNWPEAGGLMSDVPMAEQTENDYFIGPVRESLIACPFVLHDPLGLIKDGIDAHLTAASRGLRHAGYAADDVEALRRGLSRSGRLSARAIASIASTLGRVAAS